MTWVEVLTAIALAAALIATVETFRADPAWPRVKARTPGASPRQRRWMGAGLSLVMAAQLIILQLRGDSLLWAVTFALMGIGLVCFLAGVLLRPTPQEQRRRERILMQDEPGAS